MWYVVGAVLTTLIAIAVTRGRLGYPMLAPADA
jgi:hypothetical protein